MKRAEIVALDRAHVWHPYTAADDDRGADPIVVAEADGAWIVDVDGRRYLDGNASWWAMSLGHRHPRLVRALVEQAQKLDHVAFAGTTHEPAAALARDLVAVAPRGLERAFFTDNGSGAIEVAIKMALQTWANRGRPEKTRFVALDGAFHGETIGSTSLGGVDVFKKVFAGVLFDCVHVPFPDEAGYARAFEAMARLLDGEKASLAAVFVEPMVQGASGMRMYPAAYLTELRERTRDAGVLLVADEVFTGYGRTGPMWACDHAGITPDLMCVGKAMSAILPMAATLATGEVWEAFRGGREKTLWYGHTFAGNPLGAAVAREVLAIYREEDVLARARPKAARIASAFERIGRISGVARTRTLGMIGAADLAPAPSVDMGYLGDLGWRVYDEAKKRGAHLRPLGDTVYVCPPLTIDDADLERLLAIAADSIAAVSSTR